MKHYKLTLTFDYTVDDNTPDIQAARVLAGRLSEYNDRNHEVFEGIEGTHTCVVHDGAYGKKFDFTDFEKFIKGYAACFSNALTSVMNDYATFLECSVAVESGDKDSAKD